jgi:ribosomal protein S12 methylthiotransferase accessory factor
MIINFPGGKKVNAVYKGFTIKTDQPRDEGGEGASSEPFSLFLASIGTCIGIYVLSFFQMRNISINGLEMVLRFNEHKKTHMIQDIRIDIQVPKDFPDNYKNALIKTANLCTVKKHLDIPPKFDINITKK